MTAIPSTLELALAGRYAIERELGEGGMAVVYLAQDLRHHRKVAVKVLRPELAAVIGAERFLAEIRTTANLQHPHILPLFDSGIAGRNEESEPAHPATLATLAAPATFLYYVMPYVEGENLRDRLTREKQLPIPDVVRIAKEVASALDYAHRHGVIHRDIKPENILLHDGRPMVADFGIALAVSAAAGGRMTETGLSLGTPHYMSPEQATAEKELSNRSDIYSLGCVLYEMLTGSPPHVGATAQQIIMKIVTEDAAPVTKLRKSVPTNVAAAANKELEKLPADRFESAKAFADALGNPGFTVAGTSMHARASMPDPRWRRRFMVLAGATAIALAAGLLSWRFGRDRSGHPTTRFDLVLGEVVPSTGSDVVISPDGSMVAVAGTLNGEQAIYLRRLDGDPEFRKVPGTENGVGSPSFSPDNKAIAFRRQSDFKLLRIPVSGGNTIDLGQLARTIFPFAHWGSPDRIVYNAGASTGPAMVAATGGRPDTLGLPGAARTPFLLPDGSGLLYNRGRQGGELSVLDFRTDSSTRLLPFAVQPNYVASGHLLYIGENGGLYAAPFDLGRHRITGDPIQVLGQVGAGILTRGYSVSSDGVLLYHDAPSTIGALATLQSRFVIVTPGGPTDTLRLPPGQYQDPRFSPDGRSIAYEFRSGASGATFIYTFDLVSGTNTQITFEGDSDDPVWSPDGKLIAFTMSTAEAAEDIFLKPANNSRPEEVLLSRPQNQNPIAWPDSATILFTTAEFGSEDLYAMAPRKGEQPRPYLQAPWGETDIAVSPDGRLAAVRTLESGAPDLWIRDYPVAQGKWKVSSGTGANLTEPRWSRDGKYLWFWRQIAGATDTLYKVRVDRTPGVVIRAPEPVLALNVFGTQQWDLHPDGKRFIVTVDDLPRGGAPGSPAAQAPRYVVALNWFAELRAKLRR